MTASARASFAGAPAQAASVAPARATFVGRAGLALVSAGLFALSLPPADLGGLAWVALVPLHFAVRGERPGRAAALGGLFGLVSALTVFAWMFRFQAFSLHHAMGLGGYLGVFPALLAIVWARWARDARALVFVPAAAVLLEWARGHAGFLALPCATLVQTQHQNLAVVQLASLGGEPLVTLVVVLANVALALLLTSRAARRAALAALALVVVAHAGGAAMLAAPAEGEEIVVAAIQPAILPGERDEAHEEERYARLERLTREVAAARPALVVWPETAVSDPERDLVAKLRVRDLVEETGLPVLFGASETEKLAVAPTGATPRAKSFNSAYLMRPGEPVAEPYRKVRLLPFGEYRPLEGTLRLPTWLAPRMFETEAGAARRALEAGSLRVEPVICWENLFADDVRATATPEPSVIAHLVNDAWFGPTAQPYLHATANVFRAVENRRPVIVASNTGPSRILDARGRVVASTTAFFEPAAVSATVRLERGTTLYRRAGDLAWALPLLVLVALAVGSTLTRARSARRGTPALRPPA